MYLGAKGNTSKELHHVFQVYNYDYNLRTEIQCGVYKINVNGHKKGEPKYRTVCGKVISDKRWTNIRQVWRAAYEYPTVSAGLSKFERNVLIIDSDEYYNSLTELKQLVINFTNKFDLPGASYIIRNPSSGHAQFGWFLDSPIYKNKQEGAHVAWIACERTLAKLWTEYTGKEADLRYNGPACKNPFSEMFEAEVYQNIESTKIFIDRLDSLKRHISSWLYNNSLPSSSSLYRCGPQASSSETRPIQVIVTTSNGIRAVSDSRWFLVQKWTRELVWQQMRNNEKIDILPHLDEFNKRAADETGKSIESTDTVKKWMMTAGKWAERNFRRLDNDVYGDEARAWAKSVKRCQQLVRWYAWKNGELEASGGTLKRFKKLDAASYQEDVERLLGASILFKQKHAELIKSISSLYNNSLPSSSSLYRCGPKEHFLDECTTEQTTQTEQVEQKLTFEEARELLWTKYSTPKPTNYTDEPLTMGQILEKQYGKHYGRN